MKTRGYRFCFNLWHVYASMYKRTCPACQAFTGASVSAVVVCLRPHTCGLEHFQCCQVVGSTLRMGGLVFV